MWIYPSITTALYYRIVMASARSNTSLGQTSFDHKRWLAEFKSSKNFRQLRIEVMQQTLEACKNFKYSLEDGTEVTFADHDSVSRDARKTVLHIDESPLRRRQAKGGEFETKIVVLNADCLEEATRLRDEGYNPAVLNMASSRRPGTLTERCLWQ